ncbi:hypothetical protein [Amycolatopsis orientalis]|uniref:hypothetical protein n=1 Tax=Amycolatopsis orientalis TaxID=31958 RepID=UPI00056B207B|nr:hypothetical protein [Amycolatopsis orientalis]
MPVTAGSRTPRDDDLSAVLRDIAVGRKRDTRLRLANMAETRAFLNVGLELLREDLIDSAEPDFEEDERSKLFESISRDRILRKSADVAPELRLSVNMFRYRWDRKDRYTEDLISYMFRLAPQKAHLDDMETLSQSMVADLSLGQFVRRLADEEVRLMLEDPLVSLQGIVQSAMPNHPRVREFCRAQLNQLLPRWASLYAQVSHAYGVRLRPGRTWLDLAIMFNAVVEGELAWARLGQRPVLTNGDHVLAGAILAMLPTLVEGLADDLDSVHALG